MHNQQATSPQSSPEPESKPERITYSADKEFYETCVGMRLSEFSVQEFQRRDLDGEIRSYFAVTAGCDGCKETFDIPHEAGKVENERDAVLVALSQMLGFNISITRLPPRQYTEVATDRCEVTPLPLAEFLEVWSQDELPLFNLCPAYNNALARYGIFDPREHGKRDATTPLSNWVNLYGRRKTSAHEPCLLYCTTSYYVETGILGRQIDKDIFFPIIYNAKLVAISQDGDKENDAATRDAICYLRYYPHTNPNVEYSTADSCMIGAFNCMSHWYLIPDPGNYVDWQSLTAIYNSFKKAM